jgi:hypothetical protein
LAEGILVLACEIPDWHVTLWQQPTSGFSKVFTRFWSSSVQHTQLQTYLLMVIIPREPRQVMQHAWEKCEMGRNVWSENLKGRHLLKTKAYVWM